MVEREGTTAIWLYAPGIRDPGDVSGTPEARMTALTGIKLRTRSERRTLAMHATGGHPLVAGVPTERALGQWDFKIRYSDGGEVGYCAKRIGSHTSVWFGSPAMSADLLRRVLKYSGVPVYDDSNDVDYMSAGFLCVHAFDDAPQVIHFPRPVDVYDLIGDRQIARGVTELSLTLPRLDTGLYYHGKLLDFLPEWERAKAEQAADLR